MALLLWAVAAAALLVALVGQRAVQQSRAQAGADAVALAIAAAPDSGTEVADRNGVSVERLDRAADVEVTVRAGDAVATARARATRAAWEGLHPDLQQALLRAEALLGERLMVVSALRSRADQERLWGARATNPYPVARPGTSLHERGLAVDVFVGQARRLAEIADATGLCQPLPLVDPVHFTLCRTTPTR